MTAVAEGTAMTMVPYGKRNFLRFVLIISKYIYLESQKNYYTFYLIGKFGISVQLSQMFLFVFLFTAAAGASSDHRSVGRSDRNDCPGRKRETISAAHCRERKYGRCRMLFLIGRRED